ncbi:MAG: hypothetical protein RL007_208 [Bacteroidota bacterium]|jgi:hypothetical protein
MALKKYILIPFCSLLLACGAPDNSSDAKDSAGRNVDSTETAIANAINNSDKRDTVFSKALPPVFDGDIIMINSNSPQAVLLNQLVGGKYNHVGIIFQRKKDGILMVTDVQDSVVATPLTDFVASAVNGEVCVLRLKDASKVLNEDKVRSLREATRSYAKKPFDPVLNWDDSKIYSSELVWKVYDKSMMLKLCKTGTVADFDISEQKQKELSSTYGGNVSNKDEAVSPDAIYNSPKLEIIYESK